jgi:AraC family transcriptional regulator
MTDTYGRSLAKRWGLEDLPSIVTRSLRGAEIVVSDLRVNKPNGRLSDPLPRDDAYMICLVLRDLPQNSYWEEGREVGRYSLKRGQTAISDLRCEPAGLISQPIHTMLFHLPRAAINALADEISVPRVDELVFQPGVGMFDETIMHLGLSLMPALANPDRVSRLFTDHVTLALAAHCAQTYGGMQTLSKPLKGGLAPWQEKRSKEMLAGDLTGATPLHEIAGACGLSVSHFSRAFHKSTGLAPHAWLLQARVEAAKAMLRSGGVSLSTIARACGFADQSHFARVFTHRVGLSPGAWRKIALG